MHLEATTELIRLRHVKYLKEVEVKSEPSIYEKVAARLEELPLVTQRGPSFMFQVMKLIKTSGEMEYFLSFKTEAPAWCYITNRVNEAGWGMDDEENVLCVMLLDDVDDLTSEPPSIPRLPRLRSERGGESGGEFIHRIVYEEPETCKEQLRLTPYAFMQLVNLLIDRGSLMDDIKVKVPEQVGMCLFILARGASYRDVKDKFKRGIGATHDDLSFLHINGFPRQSLVQFPRSGPVSILSLVQNKNPGWFMG
ncbi:hypothetical protein Cgig2_011750 [Carnegiea gigantea]|uniref:DUF8040 domain-containing protein n=1 Tax=Carnegiea gigantea TaxID=171969 RepID=A0A9Q1JN26_9CARY|nr:hypothetical protein Cgig2_011750 [Carnegiea gigantea]